MNKKYYLKGEAKFGQHKVVYCNVCLVVESDIAENDLYAEVRQYSNIFKVTGQFSYECSPTDSHPCEANTVGELTLIDNEDSSITTKFNILIVGKNTSMEIVPKKIRKYFWNFYVIGKPVWDKLEISPNQGYQMNKVFTCLNFRGYYEVPVASIIVASTIQEARKMLIERLKESKIPLEEEHFYELQEIDLSQKSVDLLVDGSLF